MQKALADMTLQELWDLFPVILTPHNPQWKAWAAAETEHLSTVLADFSPVIRGCLIIIVNDRVVYFMLRCSL
jgi:hypothetical protein